MQFGSTNKITPKLSCQHCHESAAEENNATEPEFQDPSEHENGRVRHGPKPWAFATISFESPSCPRAGKYGSMTITAIHDRVPR